MTVVDMHCHILPGVDDGPATMKESLETLEEAQRQGIGAMIATPHYHPGRYAVTAQAAQAAFERLRRAAADAGIMVRLYLGQECYYYSGLLEQLENGSILTMNSTNFVLVEFDPDAQYTTIKRAIHELTQSGYRPIIAHYERYRCLYEKKDRLDELRSRGAMLQLNFDRLLEKDRFLKANPWRKLLKEGYVDFLGSDTHGMKFRPLHVAQSMDWLRSAARQDLNNRILVQNIQRLTGKEARRP